jgi:hypothetical protein
MPGGRRSFCSAFAKPVQDTRAGMSRDTFIKLGCLLQIVDFDGRCERYEACRFLSSKIQLRIEVSAAASGKAAAALLISAMISRRLMRKIQRSRAKYSRSKVALRRASQQKAAPYVRMGSDSVIRRWRLNVRFAPEGGRTADIGGRRKCASSGHCCHSPNEHYGMSGRITRA